MPKSTETLSDQIENDQDQFKNEQSQPGSEQDLPEGELALADNEQAQPELKDSDTKAERDKALAKLKSISPIFGRRKGSSYTEEEVLLRFTSCGRCGLFLTTYRLSYNQEFLEALEAIEADWLIFPWHPDMREMVDKSFGSPADIGSYYIEETCPECQRPFSFVETEPDQTAWFLIKL